MSFFELNYKGLILNVLQLTCLLIDDDIESNPGPMQNYKSCKSPCGRPEKIKVFKGMPKNYNLSEKINVNIASGPKLQNVFFFPIQFNLSA